MIVRPFQATDASGYARLRALLWPDEDPAILAAELEEVVRPDPAMWAFVAESDGVLIGFIEAGRRSYAEGGPAAPTAYVEGIFVEAEHRRRGVAAALLATVEAWARAQGLTWLGSDTELTNVLSQTWHQATGFKEIERLVVFGKPLD